MALHIRGAVEIRFPLPFRFRKICLYKAGRSRHQLQIFDQIGVYRGLAAHLIGFLAVTVCDGLHQIFGAIAVEIHKNPFHFFRMAGSSGIRATACTKVVFEFPTENSDWLPFIKIEKIPAAGSISLPRKRSRHDDPSNEAAT